MTRIVFVTQQVDPGHPALAATVPKIAALAALVDEVVVLADGAVEGALPANCRVRTFRASRKLGRGARFEAALARELPGLRGGAVVAHMCPIYAVLAAPLVRPLGVPLLLWFTHWRASRLLRAAERVSTAVISVDRRSFPLPSEKVRAIGHGIDLSEFSCAERNAEGDLATDCYKARAARSRALLARERARRRAAGDGGGRRWRRARRLRAGALRRRARASRRAGAARPRARARGSCHACRRGAALAHTGALREPRRARQQHARRCPGQGRLRGRRELPAGARIQPGLRRAARAGAALRAREPR